MNKPNGQWEKAWRERLQDFAPPPPPDMWERINSQLPPSVQRVPFYRKAVFRVAAVLLLLVGSSTAIWWLMPDVGKPMVLQSKHVTDEQTQPRKVEARAIPPVSPDGGAERLRPRKKQLQNEAGLHDSDEKTALLSGHVETLPTDTVEVVSVPAKENVRANGERASVHRMQQASIPQTPHKRKVWTLALVAGQGTTTSGVLTLSTYEVSEGRFLMNESEVLSSVFHTESSLPSLTDLTHDDYPIHLGLTFRYPLTDKLSLQSGLIYTRLNAYKQTYMNGGSGGVRQRIDYLGIPLTLTRSVVRKKHFGFYLQTGMMVEVPVHAEAKQWYRRGTIAMDHTTAYPLSDLQWSLKGGVGGEWKFIPSLGLYLEPGLSYYVPNGASYETVYQKHPWQIEVQGGLRFHFK